MKNSSFLIIFMLLSYQLIAQDQFIACYQLISVADSFYQEKKYYASLEAFKKAAAEYPNLLNSSYLIRGAKYAALTGKQDEAISFLNKVIAKGNIDADTYYEIYRDNCDSSLHNLLATSEWKQLLNQVRKSEDVNQHEFTDSIKNILEKVVDTDQQLRLYIDSIINVSRRTGLDYTKVIDSVNGIISKQDTINKQIVLSVIKKYYWLGIQEIGVKANEALFLVIQHSDLDPELQKRMLPILKKAQQEGQARSAHVAMLTDRVSVKEKGYQIYGTQVIYDPVTKKYVPKKISDEAKVNIYRASVGLMPLHFYLKLFNKQ